MEVPYKTKNRTTVLSCNPTPRHVPQENHNSKRYMHPNVHCSIIHHSQDMKYESVSCSVVSDSVIPWTVGCQAPLSTEFSRQEYWSGLPFPSPGDLPDPGIEPPFPASQADSLPSEPPGKPQSRHGNNLNVQR